MAAPIATDLRAGDHRSYIPPVPPTLELEVLDPRVDSKGNPAILLEKEIDCAGRENLKVDIPQTVIVHKYYFTGERDFQARILPGGPSIIVVEHPKTHERLYIDALLPPGAPRIYYWSNSIVYDYKDHGVTINFTCFGKAKVSYRNGVPLSHKLSRATKSVANATSNLVSRTPIPDAAQAVYKGTANVATTTIDRAGSVAKMATLPLANTARMLPLSQTLTSSPEEQARVLRDARIERATRRVADNDASLSRSF